MLFVPMTALILTSCAVADYDTRQSTGLVLPDVVQYSRDFQNTLADEASTGSCPAHVEVGKDYHVMRKQTIIAQESLK